MYKIAECILGSRIKPDNDSENGESAYDSEIEPDLLQPDVCGSRACSTDESEDTVALCMVMPHPGVLVARSASEGR
jgi:hypothetical protein